MTQLPKLSHLANPADAFAELNPIPRMLMGPGPINADPRVLKAMSAQLLGQFDPQFRGFMRETMTLYRQFFQTKNDWTLVLDGTARSAIEMVMMSAIEADDRVLVCSFGRFGQLLDERWAEQLRDALNRGRKQIEQFGAARQQGHHARVVRHAQRAASTGAIHIDFTEATMPAASRPHAARSWPGSP